MGLGFLIARRGRSDWELQAALFTDRWRSGLASRQRRILHVALCFSHSRAETQPSQSALFFFFLNHHIHVEDVNIHGVCGTHLCTEVTPPAWMRPYSSGNTDEMIAFVAKVKILLFFWLLSGVHDKSRHPLLVSLDGKKGGKKDLNKDTEIIIDLRRALVTALQNAPPLAHSQIIKKNGETVPSAGCRYSSASSNCRYL